MEHLDFRNEGSLTWRGEEGEASQDMVGQCGRKKSKTSSNVLDPWCVLISFALSEHKCEHYCEGTSSEMILIDRKYWGGTD